MLSAGLAPVLSDSSLSADAIPALAHIPVLGQYDFWISSGLHGGKNDANRCFSIRTCASRRNPPVPLRAKESRLTDGTQCHS